LAGSLWPGFFAKDRPLANDFVSDQEFDRPSNDSQALSLDFSPGYRRRLLSLA
jgi:hypothetical protein